MQHATCKYKKTKSCNIQHANIIKLMHATCKYNEDKNKTCKYLYVQKQFYKHIHLLKIIMQQTNISCKKIKNKSNKPSIGFYRKYKIIIRFFLV